jgi:hypothetical protein
MKQPNDKGIYFQKAVNFKGLFENVYQTNVLLPLNFIEIKQVTTS